MSLPRERITVISGGRITLPKRFRKELGIEEKSILEGYVYNGKIVLEVLVK